MMDKPESRIALALSGGGIRAMVFHLGVLRAMAESGLLERVDRISTVSGGSLIVGLIFKENELRWPTSQDFIDKIYPALRKNLCGRSLQWGAARQLVKPTNWRFLLSRANLLALALEKEWSIDCGLHDLPIMPEWSINGTAAENGKRFRFKCDSLGDYDLGYAEAGNFRLASAMAVSAAFPVGFGPLTLAASKYEWRKRPHWNAPPESAKVIEIGYRRLHLYDGGIYDNLGLEPFFDGGRLEAKKGVEYIIVSDAGSPLAPGFSKGPLNPFRLMRVTDIMSSQARALRVRSFMSYISGNKDRGVFFCIDAPLTCVGECRSRNFAVAFPTTLKKLDYENFDKLAAHGYGVVKNCQSAQGRSGDGRADHQGPRAL